jgi:carotenoid cleavage dioxygenase-like enzyme
MTETLSTVDPATIPYLSGRFEPVHTEIDTTDLVVQGTIPTDLTGAFMRNGPNPKFTPLGSYTYPMEGDAMIHGLWVEGGRARYANRWVRTKGMQAEERAGRALFGGLMTPAFVDTHLLEPDPDPGWPIRLDPFINVVRHAGRYLALEEGTPPYQITAGLETVGLYDFGGGLPAGMCAHPKIDPRTGEMVVFRYDLSAPFLTWAVIGPDGAVSRPATPIDGLERAHMVHDFAITENYLVVVLAPAILDQRALLTGGALLSWQPDLGTRIAVVPRDGTANVRWIETDAFWAWHFANAFETGNPGRPEHRVILDFPWWNAIGLGLSRRASTTAAFTRATLDPAARTVELTSLDQAPTEFPRIDDRLIGDVHRYVTVLGTSDRGDKVDGEHDRLIRYDTKTGDRVASEAGAVLGEVVFAPRNGSREELDEYYLTFATAFGTGRRAALLIWDATTFPGPPIARIAVPQRVPNGLHANWFAAA